MQADDVELDPEEREAAKAERMGLTPDWIIQAHALSSLYIISPEGPTAAAQSLFAACY